MNFKFIGSWFNIMLKATYLNSIAKKILHKKYISEWIT